MDSFFIHLILHNSIMNSPRAFKIILKSFHKIFLLKSNISIIISVLSHLINGLPQFAVPGYKSFCLQFRMCCSIVFQASVCIFLMTYEQHTKHYQKCSLCCFFFLLGRFQGLLFIYYSMKYKSTSFKQVLPSLHTYFGKIIDVETEGIQKEIQNQYLNYRRFA